MYLSNAAVESVEIGDVARKVLHNRNMIQRIQECLRAVDKVNMKYDDNFRFLKSNLDFQV